MTMSSWQRKLAGAAAGAALWLAAMPVFAQALLHVDEAWVRATVPGQPVAAAYMKLVASVPLRLVRIATPAAKTAQIHAMSNEDGITRMRELAALDLPAGQIVNLAPGGMHLMLFDLSAPLRDGERVRLTLTVRDRAGNESSQSVDAPVRRVPVE